MAVERTKRCSRCRVVKPWSAYYAGKKWEDGTMRHPLSRCKVCRGELRDDYDARHPEGKRARSRASKARRRLLNRRRVPAGPFAAWLRRVAADHVGDQSSLAGLLGLSDRGLRRIVNGEQGEVFMSTVDRALIAEGSANIDDLYPLAA